MPDIELGEKQNSTEAVQHLNEILEGHRRIKHKQQHTSHNKRLCAAKSGRSARIFWRVLEEDAVAAREAI